MMSRAREYSNHLLREHRSVGLSFHAENLAITAELKDEVNLTNLNFLNPGEIPSEPPN